MMRKRAVNDGRRELPQGETSPGQDPLSAHPGAGLYSIAPQFTMEFFKRRLNGEADNED
jgi:hypothetical protein